MSSPQKRPLSNDWSFLACKKTKPNIKHHDTYYFPDGNVIITLRDVQFRVHLSQLARKSSVFKELSESEPQECLPDGTRSYFSMDDPDDFAATLQCIYDGMQLLDEDDVDFDRLASIIRSSNKYGFSKSRDWAIARLEKLIPSKLEDFNSDDHPEQAPIAINIARQCNLRHLLKPAFYRMVRARRSDIVSRPPSGPSADSVPNRDGGYKPSYDSAAFAAAEAALSKEDIILASHLLQEFTARWMAIATTVPSPKCKTPSTKCPAVFVNNWWVRVVKSSKIFQNGVFDPLGSLDSLIAIDWGADGGVCAECLGTQRAIWRYHKAKLWEDMDEWIEADERNRTPAKGEDEDEDMLLLPPRDEEEEQTNVEEPESPQFNGIHDKLTRGNITEDMDEGD